jgi:hypothetical protein
MGGENFVNEFLSLPRQMNDKTASIRGVTFASDKPAFFQVVNDHGDIAAASQYFPTQVFLGEGAKVVNRLKHTELTDSQSGR